MRSNTRAILEIFGPVVLLSVLFGVAAGWALRCGCDEVSASEVRSMRVTAYCPCAKCCGRFSDGITASGRPVTYNSGHFVAAPESFAFGTIVEVPGYGRAEVIDRGGAIEGDRLDVFFSTHQKALDWGVQQLDVRIWPQ